MLGNWRIRNKKEIIAILEKNRYTQDADYPNVYYKEGYPSFNEEMFKFCGDLVPIKPTNLIKYVIGTINVIPVILYGMKSGK
jgi:hypothetical protein